MDFFFWRSEHEPNPHAEPCWTHPLKVFESNLIFHIFVGSNFKFWLSLSSEGVPVIKEKKNVATPLTSAQSCNISYMCKFLTWFFSFLKKKNTNENHGKQKRQNWVKSLIYWLTAKYTGHNLQIWPHVDYYICFILHFREARICIIESCAALHCICQSQSICVCLWWNINTRLINWTFYVDASFQSEVCVLKRLCSATYFEFR